jgi:HEAT repeat protein
MQSPIPSHFDNLLRNLRDYRSATVEPLCLALRDKDLNVRVAAAESLGQVGDEQAGQPLIEALRGCFVRQSARWQFANVDGCA